MPARELKITCPGCGEVLRVDPRSGKVLSHGSTEGPRDLGEALGRVEKARTRKNSDFQSALDAERRRKKELEDLFRKASEEAGKKDDQPPENPLDDRWR